MKYTHRATASRHPIVRTHFFANCRWQSRLPLRRHPRNGRVRFPPGERASSFRFDFGQCLSQEVSRPLFHAFSVPKRCSAVSRRIREASGDAVHSALHLIQHLLAFATGYSTVIAERARFDATLSFASPAVSEKVKTRNLIVQRRTGLPARAAAGRSPLPGCCSLTVRSSATENVCAYPWPGFKVLLCASTL